MTDPVLMDKSLRSVFVGNIPYEATEEKLKDIFSEVGPVLSFKLVYDRETGKPKGYGFCEYKDQETALSAMRNLNSYEIGGRTLRVDNACTEKSRMEIQNLLQGPVVENPYGEAVQSDKAPEAISKAVASLPPEQMFDLMKQMKTCVQNNPSEARAMLLQNPQLAYALLQAQVVMKIVDPISAMNMLHKANPIPPTLMPPDKPVVLGGPSLPQPAPPQQMPAAPMVRDETWPIPTGVPAPRIVPVPQPVQAPVFMGSDVDHRPMDPRLSRMGDQDLRVLPVPAPVAPPQPLPVRDPREPFPSEHFSRDPRGAVVERFPMRDPRTGAAPLPVAPPRAPGLPTLGPRSGSAVTMSPNISAGATDQEKAALIMQVLQLSDEQIAMLPPEQRQSILVLKEQIAKSTQR